MPVTQTKTRSSGLTTFDMRRLDDACVLLTRAFGFGSIYLVGTAGYGSTGKWRDVDVRAILADEEFDALFQNRSLEFWDLLCLSICGYLRERTGLPIDFQIQRQTEANAKHKKPRNPLGCRRRYAAGGDGTPGYLQEN